jgi:hypothetical protein
MAWKWVEVFLLLLVLLVSSTSFMSTDASFSLLRYKRVGKCVEHIDRGDSVLTGSWLKYDDLLVSSPPLCYSRPPSPSLASWCNITRSLSSSGIIGCF